MLSIERGSSELFRQQGIQVNRINIGKDDAGFSAEEFDEVLLCDKPAGLSSLSGKMESVPRLRSIDSDRVVAGTRRIAQTGYGKQNEDRQARNDQIGRASCRERVYGPV